MNIIVCVKQVVDISEMKIDSNTNAPILTGLDKKVNDIDKNAMEEAIRIKDALGGKITAVMIGEPDAKERMKEILAMGADEGVLICPEEILDYAQLTTLLAGAIKKIGTYDLILCGEASTDMFSGQVGPRLAGILDISQITYAQKIDATSDLVSAERNLGDTVVTVESTYPVLVTVTKEINEPRLPSLMQILASANKTIHEWSINDLGVSLDRKVVVTELQGISMDRKQEIFEDDLDASVQKLVDRLMKDGVLR